MEFNKTVDEMRAYLIDKFLRKFLKLSKFSS